MSGSEAAVIQDAKDAGKNVRETVSIRKVRYGFNSTEYRESSAPHRGDNPEISKQAIVPIKVHHDIDQDFNGGFDLRDDPNCTGAAEENLGVESRKRAVDVNKGHFSSVAPFDDHSAVKGKTKADSHVALNERRRSVNQEVGENKPWSERNLQAEDCESHASLHYNRRSSSCYSNRQHRKEGFPRSTDYTGEYEDILRKIEDLRCQILQAHIIPESKRRNQISRVQDVYSNVEYGTDLNGHLPERRHLPNSHVHHLPSMNERGKNAGSYHHQMICVQKELPRYNNSHTLAAHGGFCEPCSMHVQQPSSTYRYGRSGRVPARIHSHDINQPHFSYENFHDNYQRGCGSRSPYRGSISGFYPVDSNKSQTTQRYSSRHTNLASNSSVIQKDNKFSSTMPARHRCQQLAGGAPYIICNNCFVLLLLPPGIPKKTDQANLRCGECSQVITVAVTKNRLRIIMDFALTDPARCGLKQQALSSEGSLVDLTNNGPCSNNDPIANSIAVVSKLKNTCSNESLQNSYSPKLISASKETSTNCSPRHEKYHGNVDGSKDIIHEKPILNSDVHDSSPGVSPSRDCLDQHSFDRGVIKYVFGNFAGLSECGSIVPVNNNRHHTPTKNVDLVTELELCPSEYPKVSYFGSPVEKKEDDSLGIIKGDSSLKTDVEIKDQPQLAKSPENRKIKVSINGYSISEKIARQASKKAGPIQSGDYWYDYTAGFWGIMGWPCLGIIPPGIEEFNFPMAVNCSGGDSGVIVNGRELHHKDLELLVSRGLPPSRDRSYIIEVSGRVQDTTTGEELRSLGKLAPTVEKMGYGFGMRVPKINTPF